MNEKELSDKIYHLLDYNVVAMPNLKRRLSDDIVMKCKQYADHETEELQKAVKINLDAYNEVIERNTELQKENTLSKATLIIKIQQLKQENKELREGINITKFELLDIVSKALEIPQSTYSYLEDHTDGTELAIAERFITDNISKRVLELLTKTNKDE